MVMFAVPKQNIGGYKFKDDRDVEIAVARWLISTGYGLCQKGIEIPWYDNLLLVAGTVWKISGITVQLNVNCSHWCWNYRSKKYLLCKLIFWQIDIWYVVLDLNMEPAALWHISCVRSYGLVSFTEYLSSAQLSVETAYLGLRRVF
jgi:hypothetical protein